MRLRSRKAPNRGCLRHSHERKSTYIPAFSGWKLVMTIAPLRGAAEAWPHEKHDNCSITSPLSGCESAAPLFTFPPFTSQDIRRRLRSPGITVPLGESNLLISRFVSLVFLRSWSIIRNFIRRARRYCSLIERRRSGSSAVIG